MNIFWCKLYRLGTCTVPPVPIVQGDIALIGPALGALDVDLAIHLEAMQHGGRARDAVRAAKQAAAAQEARSMLGAPQSLSHIRACLALSADCSCTIPAMPNKRYLHFISEVRDLAAPISAELGAHRQLIIGSLGLLRLLMLFLSWPFPAPM